MWLLEGEFKENELGKTGKKLLRPGVEYPLGRETGKVVPNKIYMQNKAISRATGSFIVAKFPDNLHADPEVSFKVDGTKNFAEVYRDGGLLEREFDGTISLEPGDVVKKGSLVIVRIINEPIFVYASPSIDRQLVSNLEIRARILGVRVSRTWSDKLTTHYLVHQLPERDNESPTPYPFELLTGLLNGAHFVAPSWVEEFITRGERPGGQGNLEDVYDPPKVEDYVVEGNHAQLWEPLDARQDLFKNVKFIALSDSEKPKKNFDKLIAAGKGKLVTYNTNGDSAVDNAEKWATYVRRSRSNKGKDADIQVVLIALSIEIISAYDDWEHIYVEGSSMMDMRIISEDDLALAIFHADLAYIDCSTDHDLPQISTKVRVPSPSPAQPPATKTVRSMLEESKFDPNALSPIKNSTGRDIPQPSSLAEDPTPVLPPTSRRRARVPTTRSRLFGIEDDSFLENDSEPSQSVPESASASASVSIVPLQITNLLSEPRYETHNTVASQSIRSKRRGGAVSARDRLKLLGIDDDEEGDNAPAEPSYKKYEQDYETDLITGTFPLQSMPTDLDRPSFAQSNLSISMRDGTRSHSIAQDSDGEASQTTKSQKSGHPKGGTKRKIMSDVEEDNEVEAARGAPQSKRRATDNAVGAASTNKAAGTVALISKALTQKQNKPTPSDTLEKAEKRGAAISGVDTAPKEFLEALASKKRGKRKEDDFDREFNKLRVTVVAGGAVPDFERESARAAEMEAWDQIDKDMGTVGNFMQIIVTDDILRKDGGRKQPAPLTDTGVPNFKKFKKKVPPNRAPEVELFLESSVGYGGGTQYWEQDGAQDIALGSQLKSRQSRRPRERSASAVSASPEPPVLPSKKRKAHVASDSDDDAVQFAPTQPKGKGKGKASSTAASRRAPQKYAPPEYVPSDHEIVPSDVESIPPAQPKRAARAARVAPKRVVDDDEDFGSAMAAIPEDESDSDDPVSTMKSSGASRKAKESVQPRTIATRRSNSQAPSVGGASQAPSRGSTAAKKRVRAESESDDGVSFKGFATHKKCAKR